MEHDDREALRLGRELDMLERMLRRGCERIERRTKHNNITPELSARLEKIKVALPKDDRKGIDKSVGV